MKSIFPAACLGLAVLAGCHISAAPDPSAGLGPTARVYAPVLDEEVGGLHVDRDGLWIFSTEDKSRTSSFEPGQIVAFGDLEATARHLFVVIEVRSWGVKLQRLDTDPIDRDAEGALIPLTNPDRQTAKRWRFCVGSGDPETSNCLQSGAPGTRWYMYALDSSGRVAIENSHGPTSPRRALPAPLHGIAAVSALGVDVHQGAHAERWIAVPGAITPRPTLPRIVAAPACRSFIDDPRALDASWTIAEALPLEHPVEVTSAAFEHGADLFLSCDADAVTLTTPGLYRRRVEVPGQGFEAPPFLAAKPLRIRGADGALIRVAARAAAAVSTGDFVTADYFADRLSRMSDRDEVDTMLLSMMTALSVGGRPEAAVALGVRSTRREWNPERSAPWIWGMAVAERALGGAKRSIIRAQSLTDALDRGPDGVLRGWMAYFWTLEQLEKREDAGDVLKALESHPEFAFAARVEFARRHKPEQLSSLVDEFERRGMRGLREALDGSDVAMTCAGGACPLDVYGRLWAGGATDAESVSRVGYSSLRPGFGLVTDPRDSLDSLSATVAIYPLLAVAEQIEAVDTASRAATEWVAEHCFPKTGDVTSAIRRISRLGLDASLRLGSRDVNESDATITWLTTRGIAAACESTQALVESASELAADVKASTVPAELLGVWVERSSGVELRDVLQRSAAYVAEHERGQRCADWNLALAVDAVRGSRFEEAREFVNATTRCDVQDRFESELVGAYLSFQRSGAVSTDFDDAVRERIARVVHSSTDEPSRCLGSGQLDYHLLPEVSEPVAELVRRLPTPAASTDDEVDAVTATDRLQHARESLADVARHLDAGASAEAARALSFARERFAGLGHEVGLARVRWIDETLFSGRVGEIIAEPRAAKNLVYRVPARTKFVEHATSDGSPLEVRLAYAIAVSDEPRIRSIVESAAPNAFPVFCRAPDIRPVGTVLDRSEGGQLERVAPITID